MGGRQHTILPNFPKNCMKLKEFGPPGGHVSLAPPLDPPLPVLRYSLVTLHLMLQIDPRPIPKHQVECHHVRNASNGIQSDAGRLTLDT